MYFLMLKTHLAVFITAALCGASACATALVCLYRCRSAEMFRPAEYKSEDHHGYFAASNKLGKRIHRVRTAYAGLPGGVVGALFADLCTTLYYNTVAAPHLTRLHLLVNIGLALLAALALVAAARGLVRFAEYADYNNLIGIAKTLAWIACIAAVCALGGYGLIELLRFVPPPFILLGTLMLIALPVAVIELAHDLTKSSGKKEHIIPRYYGGISSYEADLRMRLWNERQRIEREENIRLDVRERRLGRGRGLD